MPYAPQQQYVPPQPPQVLHAPPKHLLLVYNARPIKTKGSPPLKLDPKLTQARPVHSLFRMQWQPPYMPPPQAGMYASQADMPYMPMPPMPPPGPMPPMPMAPGMPIAPGMIPNAARAAAAAAWAEREALARGQRKNDSAMPDYSDYLNAPMGTSLTPEQCAQLGVPTVMRCMFAGA